MSAQAAVMVGGHERRVNDRRASTANQTTNGGGSDGRRRPNAYAFAFRITAPFRKKLIDRNLDAVAASEIAARNTTLAIENLRVAEAALAAARVALREHLAISAEIASSAKASAGALDRLEPVA